MKKENLKKKKEKKNKIKNNNRGITLVALVVTIIILLILAGVSLSLVFDSNGLFSRAEGAALEHRGGKVEDEVTIWRNDKNIAKYTGESTLSKNELIDAQLAKGLLTETEAEQARTTGIVTIGSKTIDYGNNAKTLVQAFKDGEIQVGDYITNYNSTLYNINATVNLTPEETGIVGTQTYEVDTSTTWRIIGLNKDKTQIVITTGSPIKKQINLSATTNWEKNPYLYLSGAEGWYNTNDELVLNNNILDKVCSIYNGKYASSTKSIRIEDINTAIGRTLYGSQNYNRNTIYL